MRLLEEVLKGKFELYPDEPEKMAHLKKSLMRDLDRAYAVDIQHVHDWDLDVNFTTKDLSKTWPLIKPPFPDMWLEFSTTDQDAGGGGNYRIGVLISDEDTEEWGRNRRNCMQGTVFFEVGPKVIVPGQFYCYWSEDFAFQNANVSAENHHFQKAVTRVQRTVLFSMCFFHCKNVELKAVQNARKVEKKFKKTYGFAKPTFHIVEVHRTMTRTLSEPALDGKKGKPQPARIIRGHFKKYGEDNKLFGKRVGQWFWEFQVRGDLGQPLANDYRVWPPSKEHKDRCIISEGK